ncbi:MAG: hypothetical protein QXO40_00120 [Candidatus Aenigmatarchaeota archaeon]
MVEINFYGDEMWFDKVDYIISQKDLDVLLQRLKEKILNTDLDEMPISSPIFKFFNSPIGKLLFGMFDFTKLKIKTNIRYIQIRFFNFEYIIKVDF